MSQRDQNLSIEQELSHRVFSDRVSHLSLSEAQELLIQMHRQTMVKDNLYKELFLSQEKDIVDSLFGVGR
ncbi:MAG: NblA/ycf18 family protein [Cyanobacteria bacterium J06623_7]